MFSKIVLEKSHSYKLIMTKKEIKKNAYNRIIKGNETHQIVYNDLKTTKSNFNIAIANELKKIPSRSIIKKYNPARYLYITLLSLKLTFDLFLFIAGVISGEFFWTTICFIRLIVLILGIYGAANHITTYYLIIVTVTGFGLIFSMGGIIMDPLILILYSVPIGIIITGTILLYKTETKYRKKTSMSNLNGVKQYHIDIKFKDEIFITDIGVLDNEI